MNYSYLIDEGPLIRCEEYSLPVEIAVHVEGVLNLADLPPVVHSNARRKSTPISEEEVQPQYYSPYGTILPNYVTPGLLRKVYHIDSSKGSPFVSQGVYQTSNEYFSPSDLSAFQQFMAIPVESVAVVIGGHVSTTGCDPSQSCSEGNLDVQYLMGVSQGTPTTYYYSDDKNFMLDFLTSVASMKSPPLVMSISWGCSEKQVSASYMTLVNNEAIILSAMGVSLLAASGDDGANGGLKSCGYNNLFPASSAYFTAVGATNVRANNRKKPLYPNIVCCYI